MTPDVDGNPDRFVLPSAPRLLIIKLSAIGDVIHALPVLHALRALRPQAHITWATHALSGNLLQEHPELDRLLILPRRKAEAARMGGWWKVLGQLRGKDDGSAESSSPYDAVLDLQGLLKSGIAARLSGARRRVGLGGVNSREMNSLFMTHTVPPPSPQANIIQINLALLTQLGLDPTAVEPTAIIPDREPDRQAITDWARSTGVDGEQFLVLDPFAGWETKTWPVSHWGAMAQQAQSTTGLRTLIFYGPKERVHAEEFAGELRRSWGVQGMLAPNTTLGQAAALLRSHAAAFIGGDTGPAHLAAALGVPTVAIFGPSCNQRNAPLFAHARVRTLQDRTHPCTNTFRRKCPLHQTPDHCMSRTTAEQVYLALQEVMAGGE